MGTEDDDGASVEFISSYRSSRNLPVREFPNRLAKIELPGESPSFITSTWAFSITRKMGSQLRVFNAFNLL